LDALPEESREKEKLTQTRGKATMSNAHSASPDGHTEKSLDI
jgi:hypothetical protein